jgi:hypothetical protein
LRSIETPSGMVTAPSAASSRENAASSVATRTCPIDDAPRQAVTVSSAKAAASSRRTSSASPTKRDLPSAGGFTGTRATYFCITAILPAASARARGSLDGH